MKRVIVGVISSAMYLSHAAFAGTMYVSPSGSDSAAGTIQDPYKTIAKAAGIAVAGDTVFIREGTYEEELRPQNSGTAGNPIIFTSYQDEKVTITAMQALSGWQLDAGSVYKNTVTWDLGQQNFIMNDNTALDLARWPNNTDGDPFTLNSRRNNGGSGSNVGAGAYLTYNAGIPNVDWSNGGSIFFYGDKPGSGWLTWRAFITSNTTTRVNFSLADKSPSWIRTAHDPAGGGEFFLQGVRGALDYQNEWYFDPSTKELFVQLPNGVEPTDGLVKMRRRLNTVDLSDRSYIEIRDLAVFGGSIRITGNANNNLLYGVSSFYGNNDVGVSTGFAASSESIRITGANNTIERSEIGFGAGSGIRDNGTNTKVLNSYIHDFNYLGDYNAPLRAREGSGTIVKNNVVTRGGRDGITSINRDAEFSYNDVSYSNLIADDCALFYTVGGPQNVMIHHNWFHDAYSHGSKTKAAGVYLDNDSEGFKVFNNVIWNTEWTAVQINWNGKDLDIFNNTLWNNSKAMGAWHKAGTSFSNVRVWNNSSDNNAWEPQSNKQNNVTLPNANGFVDAANGNFQLKANSPLVNAGRQITGVTEGFSGSAPDVGAYEYNGTLWVAGVSWNLSDGPASRCYGLPGESCATSNPAPDVITVPGRVQAEDYANAFDTTSANEGGQYRTDEVDIEVTTDIGGGYNVGWIADGEWLEYDIDVTEAGAYEIGARVAANAGVSSFDYQVDGVTVGSTVSVNATGGWQTWETITMDIGQLSEGLHTVRVNIAVGSFNLNWLQFDRRATPTPTPEPTQEPTPGPTQEPTPEPTSDPSSNTISFDGAAPTTVPVSASQSFTVQYNASEARDLYVVVFDESWGYLGGMNESVSAGSGTTTLNITLSRVPTNNETLRVKLENRPAGAAWDAAGVVQSSITVIAEEPTITENTVVFDGTAPSAIPQTTAQSFTIRYTATEARDLYVVMFDANWAYLAGLKRTVSAGAGSEVMSMTLPAVPISNTDYRIKIENRPVGGAWNAPGVVQSSITVQSQ